MKRVAVALALVAIVAGAISASAVLASPGAKKAAVTVNVTASDFKFKLSKLKVAKGSTVTFKVVNKGNTAHDFDFTTVKGGTKYLAKNQKASFKVTFKKAGSYRFVCTVPRHIELGMAGKFKVS
jgi:plastocyanin